MAGKVPVPLNRIRELSYAHGGWHNSDAKNGGIKFINDVEVQDMANIRKQLLCPSQAGGVHLLGDLGGTGARLCKSTFPTTCLGVE